MCAQLIRACDEAVGSSWLCNICSELAVDIVDAPCCGKCFCRSCISHSYKETTTTCPTCRAPLDSSILTRSTLAIVLALNNLRVLCPHHIIGGEKETEGCTAQLTYCEVKQHLATTCLFHETECKWCHKTDILRKDLQQHMNACPDRSVKCEECNHDMKASELPGHLRDICADKSVLCTAGTCTTFVRRRDLQTHLIADCAHTPRKCLFAWAGCTEMMLAGEKQKHLQTNEARHFELMATAHAEDRSKIKSLETRLAALEQSVATLCQPSARRRTKRPRDERSTVTSDESEQSTEETCDSKHVDVSISADHKAGRIPKISPSRIEDSPPFVQVVGGLDFDLYLDATRKGFYLVNHARQTQTQSIFKAENYVRLADLCSEEGYVITAMTINQPTGVIFLLVSSCDHVFEQNSSFIFAVDAQRKYRINSTAYLTNEIGQITRNLQYIQVSEDGKFLYVANSSHIFMFKYKGGYAEWETEMANTIGLLTRGSNLEVLSNQYHTTFDSHSHMKLQTQRFVSRNGPEYKQIWPLSGDLYLVLRRDARMLEVVRYQRINDSLCRPVTERCLVFSSLPRAFSVITVSKHTRVIVACEKHVCSFHL